MTEGSVDNGTPRFRVKGAWTMRWESVMLPFPMVSGVKSADAGPFGASAWGDICLAEV